MAEGLRERKKRQAKQRISDMATGLFLQHGFVTVTVAEIADLADVSVNTVYNYFPAKEDLFLDRMKGVTQRVARYVRARDPGESAAEAVLREVRAAVVAVSPEFGLMDGFADFMRVIEDAPTLKARLWYLQQEVLQSVVATLREDTGASEGDPLPLLVGGQIAWIESALVGYVSQEMMKGRKAVEVSHDALGVLDDIEGLLGDQVLNYARRGAE
ncbi:TetR/AcrR family transcriptional regulator [Streptomyces anulatus]|uniref:TetR/AcrR family transcriptional regulator n=1 Tax=Streptomyces TaxID=1883 RepID=UPI000BF07FC2|nr:MULTISPECIES: TetR/AcrR family transcriptional regulator [unclassified Streptomyces]UPT44726.1 TetR/AcrR family transcriptional regulator [Streptomyces sp. WAC00303]WTF61526.1 TetR/AcrR family transcriptional regulator [Streptomyces anulatus]